MSSIHDPTFEYKEDAPEELWYHSTLISPIVFHYFKIYIITFSISIPSTLLFQNINGRIKVRDDTTNNNILIKKEVQGFNYDFPIFYVLHSHVNHFMWVKKKQFYNHLHFLKIV